MKREEKSGVKEMLNKKPNKMQLHKLDLLINEFQQISAQLHAKHAQLSSKIKLLQN